MRRAASRKRPHKQSGFCTSKAVLYLESKITILTNVSKLSTTLVICKKKQQKQQQEIERHKLSIQPISTRVPGLSCGVVCVILRLAVLVELRLVTDRHRHRPMVSTADA